MNAQERSTVARILKVNHAGEYGAIRIYRAQIWFARRLYPDLCPFLEETLGHEIRHCALFRQAMPARGARPCRVMAFWGNGGFALGALTVALGRQGVWICTAAVEGVVHKHLEDQLFFLRERDPALHALIASIQGEELAHLRHAEDRLEAETWWSRLIGTVISKATDAVIWLSTWGDSSEMARDLAAAKRAA